MSHHLVQGPDAMAVLNRVCANDVDTAVGRVVYTQWLDERGGIIADVTVTRLAEDTYVVISGDNIHRRVPAWIRRQTRDGRVRHRHRRDRAATRCCRCRARGRASCCSG